MSQAGVSDVCLDWHWPTRVASGMGVYSNKSLLEEGKLTKLAYFYECTHLVDK
jgi:hypothetical protein